MLEIKGFNLYSFTVGCKHTRAFSVDNVGGVIADYVLGECGAENSPFTSDFYHTVTSGPGVIELFSNDETRRFTATRDRVNLSERTSKIDEKIEDEENIFKQSKHVIPGTLSFMHNPKSIFLGMVWQLKEAEISERKRFKHPAAQSISEKTIKFKLDNKEYASEASVKLCFRKKLEKSWLIRDMDDYINVILNIADINITDLLPREKKDDKKDDDEKPHITTISVDIQRMFDPHRELKPRTFDIHWNYCKKLLTERITDLLCEIGYDKA